MNQNSLFHQNHFFKFNEVPGAHLVDVHARTYRTAQVVDPAPLHLVITSIVQLASERGHMLAYKIIYPDIN